MPCPKRSASLVGSCQSAATLRPAGDSNRRETRAARFSGLQGLFRVRGDVGVHPGDISWVDVSAESLNGAARLTLTHTALLSPHWDEYGAGGRASEGKAFIAHSNGGVGRGICQGGSRPGGRPRRSKAKNGLLHGAICRIDFDRQRAGSRGNSYQLCLTGFRT